MSIALKGRIVLVGCGKMGGAMLEGWLKAGVPAAKIIGLDPKPPQEMADMIVAKNIALNPAIASIIDAEACESRVHRKVSIVVTGSGVGRFNEEDGLSIVGLL